MPDERTEFFGSNDPYLRELYLNTIKHLDLASFSAFSEKRTELIVEKVKDFLALN
jgi:hypothetical protein